MQHVPKGLRLHIGIYGRRNAGKSSLLNALAGQPLSIVSPVPGTTTDTVEKCMELSPLGPVVLLDTAGLDDEGPLGSQRVLRARDTLQRVDMALLVAEAGGWGDAENALAEDLQARNIPFLAVIAKTDLRPPAPETAAYLEARNIPHVAVAAATGHGLSILRRAIVGLAPDDAPSAPPLAADLLPVGGMALLVTPIDSGAPKGRLILPQVQTIRDLLDGGRQCVIVREHELEAALRRAGAPDLVICDSQVVRRVADTLPPRLPLTTFSILLARKKGDLPLLAAGAATMHALHPGDKVLVAEACTHHPQADDIGRVKIPHWLRAHAGGELQIETTAGAAFPQDLSPWKLVLHCGGCTITRRHMAARLFDAAAAGVPVTNYGLAISLMQGVLERTLSPFPDALAAYHAAARTNKSPTPKEA